MVDRRETQYVIITSICVCRGNKSHGKHIWQMCVLYEILIVFNARHRFAVNSIRPFAYFAKVKLFARDRLDVCECGVRARTATTTLRYLLNDKLNDGTGSTIAHSDGENKMTLHN